MFILFLVVYFSLVKVLCMFGICLEEHYKKNVHSWHFLNARNASINARKQVPDI
jgi:hypothetical protein